MPGRPDRKKPRSQLKTEAGGLLFVILFVCLRAQLLAGLGACRDILDAVAAGAITPRLGLFLITAFLTVFWTVGAHWIGGVLGFQLTEEALSTVAAGVLVASLIIFRPVMAQKQWSGRTNPSLG